MIRTFVVAVSCVLFVGACRSQRPPEEAAVESQTSRVVFDGATLSGWDGDARFWSVEDGCIVGRSTTEVPCAETTYLLWRGGELADFELGFDFKIEGGNSGLQFRSVDRGGWSVAGFQADIEDGPNWTGCLYEQDGAGVVATRGEDVTLGSNGVAKSRFAEADELLALVRPREWNRYVVRARGAEVELEINGHRTARVLDLRPERRTSGLIALQMHAGPPMKVAYRNFELRELERVEPAPIAEIELPQTPPKSAAAPVQPSSSGVRPLWLWASDATPDGDTSVLRRSFDVRATPTKAVLRASADNHVRLFVNGELALENHDWAAPVEVDATQWLRAGENELALIAKNDGGPAGVWVELIVDGAQGRLVRVITDTSWSAVRALASTDFDAWTPRDFDATRSAAPHSFGAFGVGPWGSASNSSNDDGPDESALLADQLSLLPGFRAELLYSVPKDEQGSWVSMCEDPRGRLYVSDQYGALYRVTVGADASHTRIEKVPLALGSAHGLCWAFDSLYVVVSDGGGGNNGLYRVRDTDGDDVLDASELLRKFEGGGEHGPHAVVLGPDDRLWIVGGNHTKLPEPIDSYRLPKTWGEDMLLPRIEDPNGHAVGIRAPGGWIVNTDANGKRWELWCAGFRNAYDIAFDAQGELFTFDSDMEWDIGTPWYQPTRIFHCVSGADFGWRGGPGKMPPDYPDTLPSVVDIGLSSPTGVAFGTGAKFPPKYQRAMFALDWAYGTLYAVHMEPKGASFTGSFEKFATGKPFPVTDVVIGRDGAMYVTTGGRKTQSGLYRISWAGDLESEPIDVVRARERAAQGARNHREQSRETSSFHGVSTADWSAFERSEWAIELCVQTQGSRDPFEKRAALVALEQIPPSEWLPYNKHSLPRSARMCIAALHADPVGQRDEIVQRVLAADMSRVDGAELLDYSRVVQLMLIRCPRLDEPTLGKLRKKIEGLRRMSESWPRVSRELTPLLVALDSAEIVEPAIALMESDAPQEEKIWTAYCLRCAKVGWTPELRVRFFTALDTLHATAKGGFSLTKYLEEIRRQSIDALSEDEKKALGALLAPPAARARPQAALDARFVQAWTREQLAPSLRDELRGRNFESGRIAFAKARCTECHRMGGEGGATGPDITGAGSRFSRSDWLEAVLEPSKAISDQYQDTEILTHDGDLLVGRVERDDAHGLALRRLPPQDDVIELAHTEIDRRRLHPVSRMPAGLLDVLTHDEILDLAAYVLSGANAEAAEFRP